MMKKSLFAASLSALLASHAAIADTAAVNPNVAEARSIVQEFASSLTNELMTAINEGGPANGIKVCQERAPVIAADLAERTGWSVARTSLKTRNVTANSPDAWEASVLADFDARQAAGEDVVPMAHAEVIETDDGKVFRFMKAIPTAEICLRCHGSDIAPEVVAVLDEAYPQDMARGYEVGQVRGAFTLSKSLP